MITLIGNYLPDSQESMQRFGNLLLREYRRLNRTVELIRPAAFLSHLFKPRSFLWKWAGYFDKFVLFRFTSRPGPAAVTHILDHSNAGYGQWAKRPVVITCHDLLAVRGSLEEETDCPASKAGRILQRWILQSLGQADAVACVSEATARDCERLLPRDKRRRPTIVVIENGLNYPYLPIAPTEAWQRLANYPRIRPHLPFVLHVGSNLVRKNREVFLRAVAKVNETWKVQAVFAGEPLSLAHCRLARKSGFEIVEIVSPDSPLLAALYRLAHALFFPSRFEGFGWPIAEAQACGCPVVCSSEAPMGDVAGGGGLVHRSDQVDAFADSLLALRDREVREKQIQQGLENVKRFDPTKMARSYLDLYERLKKAG